jgi:hypothetical protein
MPLFGIVVSPLHVNGHDLASLVLMTPAGPACLAPIS